MGVKPGLSSSGKNTDMRCLKTWREAVNLHNDEFHNLYFVPNISKTINSRINGLADHVARMREIGNPYKIFIGKPE
jgi:hypothetical protein